MSDTSQLYEKIVRLEASWAKGGGKLPPPFLIRTAGDSTRDELSRLPKSTFPNARKVVATFFRRDGQTSLPFRLKELGYE